MPINEINENISSQFPFKTEQNLIKSDWKYSIWDRKQVRIKVTTSGELAVQTVAQNIFAFLASKFLKFFSCNRVKSFGKKVESFTFTGYNLPSNLAVPLSEQKQKDLIGIQSELLGRFFLPTHKKLNDLGTELIEVALQDPENCGQAVRAKILDMCQEILDFQLLFSEEMQKDLSPAELYAKFQEYEKQTEKFCREFPIALKDFIEKNKEVKEEPSNEEVKEVDIVIEEEVPTPLKKAYLDLLSAARTKVEELKNRLQLTSADWLEQEIENTVKHLSNEEEGDLSLKLAIESLEDALDCTEDDTGFAIQLQALPVDSPYEQRLKGLVIFDIRRTLAKFSQACEAKEKEISKLLQNFGSFPWHQDLVRFFEATREKTQRYAENYNGFESSIPGLETSLHWINPWIGNYNPLIALESLDRHLLIKHKNHVEHYCASTLDFIENETQVEKISKLVAQYEELNARASQMLGRLGEKQYLYRAELEKIKNEEEASIGAISSSLAISNDCYRYVKTLEEAIAALQGKLNDIEKCPEIDLIDQLTALEKLESPLYESLHSQLIKESKIQLKTFIDVLNGYQTTLSAAIPILKENRPDMVEKLLKLEEMIKAKIAEAQALTVDFTTRLHFLQLFSSDVAVDDLPPKQLKDYMSKVSRLVVRGIEEITKEAENIGIQFN